MSKPIIILGAGGHAKVLIEALRQSGRTISGLLTTDPTLSGSNILGIPVLGSDEVINSFSPYDIRLVNGLGSVDLPLNRQRIFERFNCMGYKFATSIHPSAVIATDVLLGEGVQVMAGSVIQPGCRIGNNSIINTRASVDHDCTIGDHVHIAPGVTASGSVRIGSGSHIGTGATLIQGVAIGNGCLIAAGALVVKDICDGAKARGVPAKEFA